MRIRRSTTRPLSVLAATAAVVMIGVTPAQAHAIQASGTLYKSADLCTRGYLSFAHRYPEAVGGWMDARTASLTRNIGSPQVHCSVVWSRPAGNIRVNQNWWVWSDYPQGWDLCWQSGWYTNPNPVTWYGIDVKFAPNAPCFSGWYLGQSLHGVWNSGWYGGTLQLSAAHHLPDSSSIAAETPPPVPDKFPARAHMRGPDGKRIVDSNGNPILVDVVPPDDMVGEAGLRRRVAGPDGSVGEQVIISKISK